MYDPYNQCQRESALTFRSLKPCCVARRVSGSIDFQGNKHEFVGLSYATPNDTILQFTAPLVACIDVQKVPAIDQHRILSS